MPALRDATAPPIRPITVVRRIATTSESVGSQPRWRPFDVPPSPPWVARLPMITPATPNSAVWASETIPP